MSRVLSMYATVEESDYDRALAAAQRLVPEGWRIIALRVERD